MRVALMHDSLSRRHLNVGTSITIMACRAGIINSIVALIDRMRSIEASSSPVCWVCN